MISMKTRRAIDYNLKTLEGCINLDTELLISSNITLKPSSIFANLPTNFNKKKKKKGLKISSSSVK